MEDVKLHSELLTVKKKQISARLALPENHEARGIIFIVGVYGANGIEIDVKNVETTFKELNFVTYIVQDPLADEISALIQAAADVQLYPDSGFEYVAFYFAGHGGRDEECKMFIVGLQKNDDKKEILYVDDHIINPLKCLHERKLSRLFFFDCSQSSADSTAYRSSSVRMPKPHPGEIIAYATNVGGHSRGDKRKGGIWTYHLCKNILELDEPITTILSKTYDDVVKAQDGFQQPLVVATLGMRKLKNVKIDYKYRYTEMHDKIKYAFKVADNRFQGIAYVISGDAVGATTDESIMSNIFRKKLNFAEYHVSLASKTDMIDLISAAVHFKYPIFCEYIAFYYSGHGGIEDGKPFLLPKQNSLEDKVFIEDDIFEPFQSRDDVSFKGACNTKMKCLFFFDCCLLDPRAESNSSVASTEHFKNTDSNSIIAYATAIGSEAQGENCEGGAWTKHLSNCLETASDNESLNEILSSARDATMNEHNKKGADVMVKEPKKEVANQKPFMVGDPELAEKILLLHKPSQFWSSSNQVPQVTEVKGPGNPAVKGALDMRRITIEQAEWNERFEKAQMQKQIQDRTGARFSKFKAMNDGNYIDCNVKVDVGYGDSKPLTLHVKNTYVYDFEPRFEPPEYEAAVQPNDMTKIMQDQSTHHGDHHLEEFSQQLSREGFTPATVKSKEPNTSNSTIRYSPDPSLQTTSTSTTTEAHTILEEHDEQELEDLRTENDKIRTELELNGKKLAEAQDRITALENQIGTGTQSRRWFCW